MHDHKLSLLNFKKILKKYHIFVELKQKKRKKFTKKGSITIRPKIVRPE